MLPFVVSGIAAGSIYGLAAVGLVLTYKSSGIFNLGHGALATAAAYCFYWMYVDHGLDWKIAFAVSVFVVGPVLGLGMERLARRLAAQRTVWKIVGTTGLVLVAQGLATIKYGPDPVRVPSFLPKGRSTFRVFDVNVGYDQLIVTIISVVAVAALYGMFRFTRVGIAVRAVVDDPDLVDLQGTNPDRVRRRSWMVGSTLAALSGVLIVPFIGLEPVALTLLVVHAFGAAAIGYFSSIPLAFLGGIVIGVAADLSKRYVLDVDWLSGLPASLPFVVLFVALLAIPKRYLDAPSAAEARPPLQWRGPPTLRIGMGVVLLAGLVAVPMVVDTKLAFWTSGLTQALLLLSLGLLIRTAGMVSLATSAFAAIGAVAMSQFAVDLGLPWFLALLLAGLVAVPVGALIAIPAIRLSGIFLALATFGFGLMVERLLYSRGFMFTTFATGRSVPRPSFAQSDHAYYYLVLAVVVAAVIFVVSIHEGRLGRILRGLAGSSTAVTTLGLSTNLTRVIVFCTASFLAAIAGVLYGGLVRFATAGDHYYQSFTSLILVALLALAPFREPWYALFAIVATVIPGYFTGGNTTYWMNVLFGVLAIVIASEGGPIQMPGRLQALFERVRWAGMEDRRAVRAGSAPAFEERRLLRADRETRRFTTPGLAINEVTVAFGGVVAVDHVTLAAPTGRITGLIGPNGAGKTTTFNVCSGLQRASTGRVRLNGHDVTGRSPSFRAREGLGRTFQIMQLCDSLTVGENVALGRESSQAGSGLFSQLTASPVEKRLRDRAMADALELCGISHLAGLQAGALSTGQRRLVELARTLAGPFDVLLLDEPSSGLDHEETYRFGQLLRHVVEERGCGILLVEHDMELVMEICGYVYVLDFGQLIFEGQPGDVAASPVVQAAYLGSDFASDRPVGPQERS